ncbi:MAG: HD domain-containing protein [Lachnospiraceae bacterium]|nr:HD domain-containing protein [Lachnospiraceae bacterium]
MNTEYGIEKRLRELNKDLHERYRNCVTVAGQILGRYENYFPDFTDHTLLHTLDILDLCNRLIGEQITLLTDDDLYVLMMGALFHDVGMGVSYSDFEEFGRVLKIPIPANDEERAWAVRDYHQELSGLYLKKYWRMFDLPNERYAHAVIQVCRGHRKTDLMDEAGYPVQYEVEQGKTVYLPYLAALLCLADELDISTDRNISFMYDVEKMPSARDRREFRKHMAIHGLELEPEKVVVRAWSMDQEIRDGVEEVCAKLKDKLLMCRRVAAQRSPFTISQEDVELIWEVGV